MARHASDRALNPRREQVAYLTFVEQWSTRQIAERLRMHERTVRADLDVIHATMRERGSEELRQSVLGIWTVVKMSFAVRVQALWADWQACDPIQVEAELRALELAARNRGEDVPESRRTHLDLRRHRLAILRELRAEIDHYCDRADKLGLIAPVPTGATEGEYVLSVDELRETRAEIDDLLKQLGVGG